MSKKKFTGGISGKGYYIALILCAVAIGISGYLYYRNDTDAGQQLQASDQSTQQADASQDEDVPVAATPGADGETQATQDPQKPSKTVKPVSGQTISAYSMDALSYNQTTRDWRVHNGVDIAAEAGTDVAAAADGTVYTVYEDETMGMTVVIHHDGGYTTQYASLSEDVKVAPGDPVTAGQTIGYVGASALLENAIGDHVHFSVSCNGEAIDPSEFVELS